MSEIIYRTQEPATLESWAITIRGISLVLDWSSAPKRVSVVYAQSCLALAALARRATKGGSYHVRVSLSQTAMFIQRFGEYPAEIIPKKVLMPGGSGAARAGFTLCFIEETLVAPIISRFLSSQDCLGMIMKKLRISQSDRLTAACLTAALFRGGPGMVAPADATSVATGVTGGARGDAADEAARAAGAIPRAGFLLRR